MNGKKVCNWHDLCLVEKQYLLPFIDIDEENPFLNSNIYISKKVFPYSSHLRDLNDHGTLL